MCNYSTCVDFLFEAGQYRFNRDDQIYSLVKSIHTLIYQVVSRGDVGLTLIYRANPALLRVNARLMCEKGYPAFVN